MRKSQHLDDSLLIKIIDGELPCDYSAAARSHLVSCAACTQRYNDLSALSLGVEDFLASVVPGGCQNARQQLSNRLFARTTPAVSTPGKNGRAFRNLGWTAAVAATLIAGIALAPHLRQLQKSKVSAPLQSQALTYEVDGESFVALPYSNPDLPFNGSRIVEMQVPVSSLASVGMMFEPVASSVAAIDRTVLADVLLGVDGQPLGVHLLSAE